MFRFYRRLPTVQGACHKVNMQVLRPTCPRLVATSPLTGFHRREAAQLAGERRCRLAGSYPDRPITNEPTNLSNDRASKHLLRQRRVDNPVSGV